MLLEHLHDDTRVAAVGEQRGARVVEIRVGVVALPHLLDRQVEDLGGQPFRAATGSSIGPVLRGGCAVSSSRQASSAAWATSSCCGVGSAVRSGAGTRGRAAPGAGDRVPGGGASSRRSRSRRRREPIAAAGRAVGRADRATRDDHVADHRRTSSGPTRCVPQRSCSRRAARRARSCRSRCARRRGRRRARRRAARAPPARTRRAPTTSCATAVSRLARTAAGAPPPRPSRPHGRALERQPRLAAGRGACAGAGRRSRRSAPARAGAGSHAPRLQRLLARRDVRSSRSRRGWRRPTRSARARARRS